MKKKSADSREEKLFEQEVSREELKSVTGGDCGKNAFVHGPCPKGVMIVPICPNSADSILPDEKPPKPSPDEIPFYESLEEIGKK